MPRALRLTVMTQARDAGGGFVGVEARAHEAGWRALETGADAVRVALREAASQAIQHGELARRVRCGDAVTAPGH